MYVTDFPRCRYIMRARRAFACADRKQVCQSLSALAFDLSGEARSIQYVTPKAESLGSRFKKLEK